MNRLRFLVNASIIFLILFYGIKSFAQQKQQENIFVSPVDIPISLSGTFAELRSNHFHSGLDIRTQGVEGKKVFACADGYVSRIRISPFGFGKAVYIKHPGGLTTVYAHLRNFTKEIDTWAKSEQYRLRKFDVDLYPTPDRLKVKQGQIIAYSGNSGSSQGPHLHFEVRDSGTEEPLDPIHFGFGIKDIIRPVINGFRIYPASDESSINGKPEIFQDDIAGWGNTYRFRAKDTILISGDVFFGLEASDLLNGSDNKNGVNMMQVFVDSVLHFHWEANRFSFGETRYINSFIDYAAYHKTGKRYMLTRKAPQSKLSMYKSMINDGVLKSIPGKTQHIRIMIADGKRNESSLNFFIKGIEAKGAIASRTLSPQTFSYRTHNQFRTPHINISLPGKCLYEDTPFEYSAEPSEKWSCSMIHKIHHPTVPLHDYFDLMIRIDSACRALTSKLFVVKLNTSNKPSYIGGEAEGRYIKARAREFGTYTIMADTTAPTITPINISKDKNLQNQISIRLNITDDLSGIKTYNGYLNNKWILMDYDAKNNILEYAFDENLQPGKNVFRIEVTDNAANKTTYRTTLNY
ncbi:MAG: M23 family metallopeptidase [Lentimicrobium sp.]|nr:M23 family metallopeptidase [Lentimicrobium sp.]